MQAKASPDNWASKKEGKKNKRKKKRKKKTHLVEF